MANNKGNITLAIETAVTGGSLALLMDGREIVLRLGGDGILRSEDLLLNISDIFEKYEVERSDITAIAVSTGPGSYTGIRVGIATALGLKNALDITCIGIPILEAMAVAVDMKESIAAIPVGRDEVCWQLFGSAGVEGMLVDKVENFVNYLIGKKSIDAILHEKVFDQIAGHPGIDAAKMTNAGEGLACYVGIASQSREIGGDLMPIYVRDFV